MSWRFDGRQFSGPGLRLGRWRVALGLLLGLSSGIGAASGAEPHFVALSDAAPGIAQSMRYATPNNFTGALVPGYPSGECLLTEATAKALIKAEALLQAEGFGLVMFDCYRPERAVRAFVDWARRPDLDADPAKRFHAPDVAASDLFAEGYIAERSSHSRGAAVDVGLIVAGTVPWTPNAVPASGDCRAGFSPEENLVDMGASFDCFDPRGWYAAKGLTKDQAANRNRLRDAMVKAGFKPYAREWWHFSYPAGDPGRAYDFPVALEAVDK